MNMRTLIDNAIADVMAEHAKYFTPTGMRYAQGALTNKIAKALRDSLTERTDAVTEPQSAFNAFPVDPNSPEGRGLIRLRRAAGAIPSPVVTSTGNYSVTGSVTQAQLTAFGNAPSENEWPLVWDRQQIAAWFAFFEAALPSDPRRQILVPCEDSERALRVPWPWPPRKDGTAYIRQPEEDAA